MGESGNPFDEDWRDCLREHYMDVIRRHDLVTMKTLPGVMHEVGFDDDDLDILRIYATMRDDTQDDPDVTDR